SVSTYAPRWVSRTRSFTCSTPPASMSAARRASSADMPARIFSSTSSSTNPRSSRSSSRSCLSRPNIAALRRLERQRHRPREARPFLRARLELATAPGGELVVLGVAPVLGLAERRGDHARGLEPVQGREERARLDDEGALRDLLDAPRDTQAVQLA